MKPVLYPGLFGIKPGSLIISYVQSWPERHIQETANIRENQRFEEKEHSYRASNWIENQHTCIENSVRLVNNPRYITGSLHTALPLQIYDRSKYCLRVAWSNSLRSRNMTGPLSDDVVANADRVILQDLCCNITG